MLKKILLITLLALSANVHAVVYLDTQFAQDGVEVHLIKVNVANKVLTVAFMVENSTGNQVKFNSMVVGNANYTSSDRKYPVLKDANGKWLASTITYSNSGSTNALFTSKASPQSNHYLYLGNKSKRVGWVKFQAPEDNNWPIEVTLPGVSPFTINKP